MITPAPLKLLRVIARLNVGGPAHQAVLLHDRLRAFGFDTRLVHGSVAEGEASMEDLLDARGLERNKIPELGRRVRPANDLQAFWRLLRYLFAERPDIVHTHTAKAGTLGRLAAAAFNATRPRRQRCLVVHTFHGHVLNGYFGPAGNLAVRTAERALALLTDRIVTISPAQRDDIVGRYRIAPAGRVRMVRLGLDLDAFFQVKGADGAARTRLGFPPDAIVFGAIGRLVPIKDLQTLLRATAHAVAEEPRIRLAVAGDGQERGKLEQLSRNLGIEGRVTFLGWQRGLTAIYEALDVVALSSRNEGTPVALIEAMAAGRPTVATAVGGVPDVVVHEETGLLVPAGDISGFAAAMVRLARSEPERRRFGEAGRRAAAPYRSEALLDALADLYRRGLQEKRGSRKAMRANGAVVS